jgi:hypothetical protein
MAKRATSSQAVTGTVPAKKPRGGDDADVEPPSVDVVQTRLVGPTLPKNDEEKRAVNLPALMKRLIIFTRSELNAAIQSDARLSVQFGKDSFWKVLPLAIKDKGSREDLVGYKSPWDQGLCQTAATQTSMYEAVVNIDWLDPFLNEEVFQVIAGEPCTYEALEHCVGTHFQIGGMTTRASSQGSSQASSPDSRVQFPILLAGHVASVGLLAKDAFQHSIPVLDCHVYVWAWWLHAHAILVSSSSGRDYELRRHLEAGLSVSLMVRVGCSHPELAGWSASRSETVCQQDRGSPGGVCDCMPPLLSRPPPPLGQNDDKLSPSYI